MRTTTSKTTPEPVAEICLYGAGSCGFGYLGTVRGQVGLFYGDGRPSAERSATDALWLALIELRDAGVRGPVIVHAPGGLQSATVALGSRRGRGTLPTFGELCWAPSTTVYTLEASAIVGGAR